MSVKPFNTVIVKDTKNPGKIFVAKKEPNGNVAVIHGTPIGEGANAQVDVDGATEMTMKEFFQNVVAQNTPTIQQGPQKDCFEKKCC